MRDVKGKGKDGKGKFGKGKGEGEGKTACAATNVMTIEELAEDDDYDQEVDVADTIRAWELQGYHTDAAAAAAAAAATPAAEQDKRKPTGYRADGSWMECRAAGDCTHE